MGLDVQDIIEGNASEGEREQGWGGSPQRFKSGTYGREKAGLGRRSSGHRHVWDGVMQVKEKNPKFAPWRSSILGKKDVALDSWNVWSGVKNSPEEAQP